MSAPAAGAGRQPEEGDRLQCLECGRWYKSLPPHLARAHGMSGADYRTAHRLPRTLALRSSVLTRRASEQGVARYGQRPDIRAHLAAGRPLGGRTGDSTRESAEYPLVREGHRRAGQQRKAAGLRRLDERARELGFADARDYFQARADEPDRAVARELGISPTTANIWRNLTADADPLAPLVDHLLTLAAGTQQAEPPEAAQWRARAPRLAELEQLMCEPASAAPGASDPRQTGQPTEHGRDNGELAKPQRAEVLTLLRSGINAAGAAAAVGTTSTALFSHAATDGELRAALHGQPPKIQRVARHGDWLAALTRTGGNVAAAERLAGIGRNSIRAEMQSDPLFRAAVDSVLTWVRDSLVRPAGQLTPALVDKATAVLEAGGTMTQAARSAGVTVGVLDHAAKRDDRLPEHPR